MRFSQRKIFCFHFANLQKKIKIFKNSPIKYFGNVDIKEGERIKLFEQFKSLKNLWTTPLFHGISDDEMNIFIILY